MRISIVCPDALRDDANNLAMVLAFGPADGLAALAAMRLTRVEVEI